MFLLALPALFLWLGGKVDAWLQLPRLLPAPANLVLGVLLILPGLMLALWSIYSQFTLGRGTPVPLMPTQVLIVQPPFTYCRNPMALGTFLMYWGVAALFRSIGAALVVLLFALALLIYIKRVEEKELEARFGQAYLDYKQRTPFLFPRFKR